MSEYSKYVWDRLMNAIGNEYGVSGMMGNLQAESGIIPYRKQGDFTQGYTKSIAYTNAVNNGSYTERQFVNDSIGYGLAQWTYYTRKQKYYTYWKNSGIASIGDIRAGVNFLIKELQEDYPSVWNTIVTANSIREASNKVLHDFESPADQSVAVEIQRYNNSVAIYNQFSGGVVPPDPDPPTPVTGGSLPIWMMAKTLHKI